MFDHDDGEATPPQLPTQNIQNTFAPHITNKYSNISCRVRVVVIVVVVPVWISCMHSFHSSNGVCVCVFGVFVCVWNLWRDIEVERCERARIDPPKIQSGWRKLNWCEPARRAVFPRRRRRWRCCHRLLSSLRAKSMSYSLLYCTFVHHIRPKTPSQLEKHTCAQAACMPESPNTHSHMHSHKLIPHRLWVCVCVCAVGVGILLGNTRAEAAWQYARPLLGETAVVVIVVVVVVWS